MQSHLGPSVHGIPLVQNSAEIYYFGTSTSVVIDIKLLGIPENEALQDSLLRAISSGNSGFLSFSRAVMSGFGPIFI
jgi:hypothetical protein